MGALSQAVIRVNLRAEMIDVDRLRTCLDDAQEAEPWLRSLHVANLPAAHSNLTRIAEHGVTLDLLSQISEQFAAVAPTLADPDMAMNNLERFIATSRNPMATAALFERDRDALPNLLQIFSTSQYLSDLLVTDQESYDLLRMTEGQPVARAALVEELLTEVRALGNHAEVMASLRRYKRRETMRIAYGDIVRNQPVETVIRQISYLADAIVEAAIDFAQRYLHEQYGCPLRSDGARSRFVVLGLGKLGGVELNYSSDIDLIFLYDEEGQTDARRNVSNQEYFERLSKEVIRLLSEPTELGSAYRVDLRLRPEGSRGSLALSFDSTLAYYDVKGRTWERQAFVKARPIAGDRELGHDLLARLEPWIYRKYLSLADITGIKSLKRRIERHVEREGGDLRNVKTGHGGIRDIEFVIQFLQLLNGGSLPEVRTPNTLEAIERLEKAGALTPDERAKLEDNYGMLRKLEHRLQMMFDLQTHLLPNDRDELAKLAVRMGYTGTRHISPLESFQQDYARRTRQNREMLDHLLHNAFPGDAVTEPEVDLINDPDPPPERIQEVLGRYPFEDLPAAYQNLMALATEKIRFLSTRRCRHFLAAIAPRLLAAIAKTPEPDTTLVNLSRVSDSLGGKAALWELLSANQPSLNLYVTLCAACPYLAGILTSHPGMIDELMDSLLVRNLPTLQILQESLAELCKGAEDIEPILHSFKNAQHLRVGVRDVLGKDDIRSTHAALSDIAEASLKQIAEREYVKLVDKYGFPTIGRPSDEELANEISRGFWQRFSQREGDTCEPVVLALGKLGGREPNYHSDLDLIFLYEAGGQTRSRTSHPPSPLWGGVGGGADGTINSHFFSEFGQRLIRVTNHLGPYGRLYEVDARLRPTGRSGALAVSFDAFARYFAEGPAQLWERQALCKARPVIGNEAVSSHAMEIVAQAAFSTPWRPEFATEIRQMRARLEDSASSRNLKRGPGGTVDTEFLVQMLQLQHGGDDPSVRVPGTLDALSALEQAGYLSAEDAEYFRGSYRFQRSIEARIRLMDAAGRHELPDNVRELAKLAYLLGYSNPSALVAEAERTFAENRARFNHLFDVAERG
ncbi:MAG: bifunctional [glutamate--ammonia ligase]-adenylyl-L-tyrosine phosphorylase/[glutamate--ammonia-ligase] adenylyltransferase [Pirellulales bacterium]